MIASQGAGVYFVADHHSANPLTPTSGSSCVPVPASRSIPAGLACTQLGNAHLVENLGDKNDTGVIKGDAGGSDGTINGDAGDDTLVGGLESDAFHGGAGANTVAYVNIAAASLTRATGITATLPSSAASSTTGNGQQGTESGTIDGNVQTLIGSNFDDTLNGGSRADTIVGAAPVGTPNVDTSAGGNDTINGNDGADTLVGGDSGSINGGNGDDQIVGGRKPGATTVIHGGNGDDTIVSGLGNDNISGDSGANTLAYGTVSQGSIPIVNRTSGVTATLPNTGQTATGGKTGGPETDTIHDDIQTLVGSNQNDVLHGSNRDDTIVGAAPVGTPGGIKTTPAGNDTINGAAGADTLVAGDSGTVNGDAGADQIVGGRSRTATTVIHGGDDNDTIVSGLGNDYSFGDGGANTLAYASVSQNGLKIIDRGTNGVTAHLAPTATTPGSGGQTGSNEHDTLHAGISTLVGSNGQRRADGRPRQRPDRRRGARRDGGGRPGPPGNDALNGGAGADLLLGSTGNDVLSGGPGVDAFAAGAGNDTVISRDTNAESPSCGAGTDTLAADSLDKIGSDCEHVDLGKGTVKPPPAPKDTTKPRLSERPGTSLLGNGHTRTVVLFLACRNEPKGCHGTFVLKTRNKVRLGRQRARRLTLGRLTFRIAHNKPKRLQLRLSKTTLKLVRRHHTIKVTAGATVRD